MQTVKIKTPLNVIVEAQHAGVGWRVLAFLLDVFFIGLYIYFITFLFFDLLNVHFVNLDEVDRYDLNAFYNTLYVILLFPALFYSLWTESLFNGQTLGKMICGIRVVKLNGYRAHFSEYFTRWAFRLVDFWTALFLLLFLIPLFGEEAALVLAVMLLFVSGIVAFFSIIRSENSQRVGDRIAGTTVLKLREKHSIHTTILEEIKEDYVPRYSQVIVLSDNDARIIKDTFVMAKKNNDRSTLVRLKLRLEKVMNVESDQGTIDFIETVMKDFNYYTQKL